MAIVAVMLLLAQPVTAQETVVRPAGQVATLSIRGFREVQPAGLTIDMAPGIFPPLPGDTLASDALQLVSETVVPVFYGTNERNLDLQIDLVDPERARDLIIQIEPIDLRPDGVARNGSIGIVQPVRLGNSGSVQSNLVTGIRGAGATVDFRIRVYRTVHTTHIDAPLVFALQLI